MEYVIDKQNYEQNVKIFFKIFGLVKQKFY
jgi:hypothetical protein